MHNNSEVSPSGEAVMRAPAKTGFRISWKIIVPICLFLLVLQLPSDVFHIDGLTVIQQRVIAIFLLAAFLWILEPIPSFATSLLVIGLELFMISDRGISFLGKPVGVEPAVFGTQINYASIMAMLANPIIVLFLGGFFLAGAATKYKLDVNLARVLLKPFGTNPNIVLLGLMSVTAIFSMFMSNTATAAMMLAVLAPVLKALPEGDRGRTAFALAIPIGANIGGIGTPVGTPPNAVAMGYLVGDRAISFGHWMAFGVPFVIVLVFLSWLLLYFLFSSKEKKIEVSLEGEFLTTPKAIIVYVTFALTVLLWMVGELFKIDANVVAIIPIVVFSVTRVMTQKDLEEISWDVLWLVAGGLALGLALDKTGLAKAMVHSIPFAAMPPTLVIIGSAVMALLMANFMSHTSTANLLLPIMAIVAGSVPALASIGGPKLLIVTVTFAASLGMCLPISTPPNALAQATGMIKTKDMAITGLVIGTVGVTMAALMLILLARFGLL